ncbi:hypothetical protein [Gordonia sp. (in: high G+C Gram-positive bacteria)]|uniref:hypothetical protein n=1 Tax=Gordonia sp. (in: high G+C Gram-positive bacteria) TaxID=84139 RepID=UPI0016A2501E|nr:hypothetical protein [Gordonia sp. (in: high G+C Gram-positive bacteria)]NLG46477.1 hypothetical protein [Gordonia sp. (in: high G+C Gram-positive bacteria)]
MTTARTMSSLQRFGAAHEFALRCIAVYLVVRVVGIVILTAFAAYHAMPMVDVLSMWDGEWMLGIAQYGYGGVPLNFTDANGIHTEFTAYAFFPGYPMTVRTLALIPGVSTFGGAMLVAVVAGPLAAVAVGHVGRLCAQRVRESVRPASTSTAGLVLVGLFAATPMSVVLNMAYTEGLFCAAAAWALVGILERQWLLAGFCAFGAGLVRPTGAAVIGAVMLAAFLARRDGPRAWAAVVIAPLGYLGYLALVGARTGSIDGWFQIQTSGWNTRIDGGAATWRFLSESLGRSSEFSAIATALIIVAVLLLAAWSVADRVPWPVLLYGGGVLASILLSDGLMMSRARLLLPAFVLLLPVALRIARRPRGEILAFLAVAAAFSGWFGAYMLTVFEYAI